jgi:LAO/AO transport system kinase
VGQSETAVSDMTDLFVVLLNPGGGDELQGIKRGVMELADILLVTKADGDLVPAANRSAADYRMAMKLIRPKYSGLRAQVLTVSSLECRGIEEAWTAMTEFHAALRDSGQLERQRAEQARRWFWSELQTIVAERILTDPELERKARALEAGVSDGSTLPQAAARSLLNALGTA